MTMPNTNPDANPDFIALDMDGPSRTADDASDTIALDMEIPAAMAPMAPVDVPVVSAETRTVSAPDFAAIAAESASNASAREANPAGPFGSIRRVTDTNRPGASVPAGTSNPATPVVTGVLPREQILRTLTDEGSGVMFRTGRADRRKTHISADELTAALGDEFADLAPRVKSSKAHFGEVMRGIKNAYDKHSTVHAWCVTRRDMERQSVAWPGDLASRWCVGMRDGSDRLGSLGDKVLVADLLVDDTIRFTGGTRETRDFVIGQFRSKNDAGEFNSTDLLAWLRVTLVDTFNAIETIGAYYVPGNHPVGGRLDRFRKAVTPLLGRGTAVDDVITGARLTEALLAGIGGMMDDIESDWSEDCIKAQERDVKKYEKACAALQQTPTDADRDLARRRAVVLPERASTYLRRINDAQAYLDGLTKLIGDDTATVRARLAAIRATVEARCDSTSAMGAAIELD